MIIKPIHDEERVGKDCLQGAHEGDLNIPEAIYHEYALRGSKTAIQPPFPNMEKPPFAQFQKARGFLFGWGQVMVRHVDNKVLWDFILTELLQAYHGQGLSLWPLQQDCLQSLELSLPALIDYEPVASNLSLSGFRILPGTAVSAFTVSCHFSQADKTLAWLEGEFLPQHLPGLIEFCGQALLRRIDPIGHAT